MCRYSKLTLRRCRGSPGAAVVQLVGGLGATGGDLVWIRVRLRAVVVLAVEQLVLALDGYAARAAGAAPSPALPVHLQALTRPHVSTTRLVHVPGDDD